MRGHLVIPKNGILYTNKPPTVYVQPPILQATLIVYQGWGDQDLLKAGRNVTIVIVSH